MTESTTLAHSILDDCGIPRKGPFDYLSIGDRVTALQARLQAFEAGNKVIRQDLNECWQFLGKLALLQNGGEIRQVAIEAEKILRKHHGG